MQHVAWLRELLRVRAPAMSSASSSRTCTHGLLGPSALWAPPPLPGCLDRWWRGEWHASEQHALQSPPPEEERCWWQRDVCSTSDDARVAAWAWHSDDAACSLLPPAALTVEALCARGKSLLLVGDSLTFQVFVALLSELSRQSSGRWRGADPKNCARPSSCVVLPCGVKLCFENAYFLSPSTVTLHNAAGRAVGTCCHACHVHRKNEPSGCPPWHDDQKAVERVPSAGDADGWRGTLRGFDEVVINMAAHWAGKRACPITVEHPDATPSLLREHNKTVSGLLDALEAARAGSTTPRLWWRTHPPGDAGCERSDEPPCEPPARDADGHGRWHLSSQITITECLSLASDGPMAPKDHSQRSRPVAHSRVFATLCDARGAWCPCGAQVTQRSAPPSRSTPACSPRSLARRATRSRGSGDRARPCTTASAGGTCPR